MLPQQLKQKERIVCWIHWTPWHRTLSYHKESNCKSSQNHRLFNIRSKFFGNIDHLEDRSSMLWNLWISNVTWLVLPRGGGGQSSFIKWPLSDRVLIWSLLVISPPNHSFFIPNSWMTSHLLGLKIFIHWSMMGRFESLLLYR